MAAMKRQRSEDEKKVYRATLIKQRQEKIKHEFEYLKDIDSFHRRAEYIKAQANEICQYASRLHLTPFRAFESALNEMINDSKFMDKFYLTVNEYGQIIPDEERIEALIFETITPEQLAKEMLSKNQEEKG